MSNSIEAVNQPSNRLGQLREERKVALTEMAQKTRLHVRQIELLEAGRYSELPGSAFVMGSLRSYCKVLGVDPEPFLSATREQYQIEQRGEGLTSPDRLSTNIPSHRASGYDQSSNKLWWGLSAICAAAAIGLFFVNPASLSGLVKRPSPVTTGSSTSAGPSSPAGNTPAATATPSTGTGSNAVSVMPADSTAPNSNPNSSQAANSNATGNVVASPAELPKPEVLAAGPATPAANSAATLPSSTSPTTPPTTKAQDSQQDSSVQLIRALEIAPKGDSWITVRDASGKTVVDRLFKANAVESIRLPSNASVTVGRASQVELKWEGQPYNFKNQVRDDVARLNFQ